MSQLKVNSIIPVAGVPTGGGGGIIQILSTTKTDVATISNDTFADISGLSLTITPTSSSSKILITASLNWNGQNDSYMALNLVRGSTNISQSTAAANDQRTSTRGGHAEAGVWMEDMHVNFLDSPNTTSATTYKLQWMSAYNSHTLSLNRPQSNINANYLICGTSSLTVMEVSA